jgi:hypothetical protein
MIVLAVLWAGGCTNDYGEFRYPKGMIAAVDAGHVGHDAAAEPDGD